MRWYFCTLKELKVLEFDERIFKSARELYWISYGLLATFSWPPTFTWPTQQSIAYSTTDGLPILFLAPTI